jgi:putative serine protease PepD
VSTENQAGPVTRDEGAAGSGDGGTTPGPLPSGAPPRSFSAPAAERPAAPSAERPAAPSAPPPAAPSAAPPAAPSAAPPAAPSAAHPAAPSAAPPAAPSAERPGAPSAAPPAAPSAAPPVPSAPVSGGAVTGWSAEASVAPGASGEDRTAPLPPVPPPPTAFSSEGANPYATPQPGSPGGPGGPAWGVPVPAPTPGPRRRGIGGLAAAVLAAALVAGGIGGGVGYWAADHDDSTSSTTVSAPGSSKDLSRSADSVAAISQKALPSVVTIEASSGQESGTGTGFVYDKQGHILTNNHVVAPAADGGKLTATFSDGKKYDAEVVGRAQGYDVAVIKLKGVSSSKLAPLALGNSDATAVGDATIAIGAPFGLSGTVTTGIVSAMHRPVASSDGTGTSSASYMSAIQTDASINPGNSGGPLLNSKGAVVGINSAIQPAGGGEGTTQSGSVGLGFAIPINQAKRVAEELIKTGQPVYPVIKVEVDPNYQGEGAKVTNISPGGPAAEAGIKSGDVITKLDDTVIDSSPTLIAEIWQHEPGSKVKVSYTRGGTSHTTTLTLDSRTGDSTQ